MEPEDRYSPDELFSIGMHYAQLQYGDRAGNLERSIALFSQVVADEAAGPGLVASACYELGISYQERPVGGKEDNLRAALAAYQRGVHAIGTPVDAVQQELLGEMLANSAGVHLMFGDETAAIRACERARAVQSPHTNPRSWGVTHQILGAAYLACEEGDRHENLRAAVAAFGTALQVRPADTEPMLHRRTAMALQHARDALAANGEPLSDYEADLIGRAQAHLARGMETGSAAELEQAMDLYRKALADTSVPLSGQFRGNALHNLAACHLQRASRPEDIELAIDLFQQALEVPERAADPLRWAMSQYSLAGALIEQPSPGREDVERAIRAAEAALELLNQVTAEEHWAKACGNLGHALVRRYQLAPDGEGEIADLHRAVEALETRLSLSERTNGTTQPPRVSLTIAYALLVGRPESGLRRAEYLRLFDQHFAAIGTASADLRSMANEMMVLSLAMLSRHDPGDLTEEFIRRCEAFLPIADPASGIDLPGLRRDLAAAYLRRLDGDRRDNVARAVAGYTALIDPAAPAPDRSAAYLDLADAHLAAGNSEQARAGYHAVLRALTELHPVALSPSTTAAESHAAAAAASLLALAKRA